MNEADFSPPLDTGIKAAVEALVGAGVETYESCEGGLGHAYPEPTVRFHGERAEGFRALWAALDRGLPVLALRRIWCVIDGEPTGPHWEMTFRRNLSKDEKGAETLQKEIQITMKGAFFCFNCGHEVATIDVPEEFCPAIDFSNARCPQCGTRGQVKPPPGGSDTLSIQERIGAIRLMNMIGHLSNQIEFFEQQVLSLDPQDLTMLDAIHYYNGWSMGYYHVLINFMPSFKEDNG